MRRAWEIADQWFWDEYHRPDNRTWGDDAEIERTWREYHCLMLGELGFGDRAHELMDAILASQFAADAWELYPDVEPALAELRGRGATASASSPTGARTWVRSWRGWDWTDTLTSSLPPGRSALRSRTRPSSAALDRADAAPHEGMMVGDSLRADVLGAERPGSPACCWCGRKVAGPTIACRGWDPRGGPRHRLPGRAAGHRRGLE